MVILRGISGVWDMRPLLVAGLWFGLDLLETHVSVTSTKSEVISVEGVHTITKAKGSSRDRS